MSCCRSIRAFRFEYIYNLPLDHPAGTFWYHSHRHGSTALQVSSGMAGALIVRGDRVPTPTTTGDIDVILKNADLTAMEDRTLVLQQIQYACLNDKGQVKVQFDPSDPSTIVAWVCDPNDVGVIENYSYPDNVPPPTRGRAYDRRIWAWRMGTIRTVHHHQRPRAAGVSGHAPAGRSAGG